MTLKVRYDEREDFYVTVTYSTNDLGSDSRSLETAATGVLQVVQIFAYLLLFKPKIMLIDEPDAHLHPDKQERLIAALESASKEFDVQIVMTTHSPNVVRAAGEASRLVWMMNGEVRDDDHDLIASLMGWGGLDRDILFFIEDEDDRPIKAILDQWPDLARRVALCRCFGVDNLPKAATVRGLLENKQLGKRAIIHRDRDFMTDEEASRWIKQYKALGCDVWMPNGSDIESHFASPEYLAALYEVDLTTATAWVKSAGATAAKLKTFKEKRKVINRLLYEDGGSPQSEELWDSLGGASASTSTGKDLFAALKPVIKKAGELDKRLDGHPVPSSYVVAPELRELLCRNPKTGDGSSI